MPVKSLSDELAKFWTNLETRRRLAAAVFSLRQGLPATRSNPVLFTTICQLFLVYLVRGRDRPSAEA